jgi:hypothetical protein
VRIDVLLRREVHSLKEYRYSRRILSAADSERAVPCTDVTRWDSVARPNDSKTLPARLAAGRPADTERVQTNSASICLSFLTLLTLVFLLTIYFKSIFEPIFVNFIILVVTILR